MGQRAGIFAHFSKFSMYAWGKNPKVLIFCTFPLEKCAATRSFKWNERLLYFLHCEIQLRLWGRNRDKTIVCPYFRRS